MKVFQVVIFAVALFFTLSSTAIEEEGFITNMKFSLNKRDTSGKITFYEDDQLQNAACYGRNGLPNYNAKPSDMIAAMSGKGQNMCYKCLEITNPKNKKKVVVKVIDECEGCSKNHVDLTTSAFKKLADLDLGVVKVTFRGVACPSKGRFPTFEKKRKTKK